MGGVGEYATNMPPRGSMVSVRGRDGCGGVRSSSAGGWLVKATSTGCGFLARYPGVPTTPSTRGLGLALWVVGCGVSPAAYDLAYVDRVRMGIGSTPG